MNDSASLSTPRGEPSVLRDRLERIAAALGQPVERFYLTSDAQASSEAEELLRLWWAIPHAAGRARVLDVARAAAAEAAPRAAAP